MHAAIFPFGLAVQHPELNSILSFKVIASLLNRQPRRQRTEPSPLESQETDPLTLGGKSSQCGAKVKGKEVTLYLRALQEAAQRATRKRSGLQIILGVGHVDEGSDHPAQRPVPTPLDLLAYRRPAR